MRSRRGTVSHMIRAMSNRVLADRANSSARVRGPIEQEATWP
jgi:hypothetical protein